MRGFYNYGEKANSNNSLGFDSNIAGIAYGIDAEINEKLTIGLGLAYIEEKSRSQEQDINIRGGDLLYMIFINLIIGI